MQNVPSEGNNPFQTINEDIFRCELQKKKSKCTFEYSYKVKSECVFKAPDTDILYWIIIIQNYLQKVFLMYYFCFLNNAN